MLSSRVRGILVRLDPRDVRIEAFRSPEEKVNENSRGIRVTHLPTGIKVVKTEKKFLRENEKDALEELEKLVKYNSIKFIEEV